MTSIGSKDGSEPRFQLQAFGFASGGVGNIMSKENDLGTLREREQSTAVFEQIPLRGWRGTVSQDYVGSDLLSIITVYERNGHGELDKRMTLQRIVDLERRDIDTASNNQFFQAA